MEIYSYFNIGDTSVPMVAKELKSTSDLNLVFKKVLKQ